MFDTNMSLPTEYSALLNDLNRDVLRAQPTDPLQFCASWFFSRLEQERSSTRRPSTSPPAATTGQQPLSPPAARRSITPPAPLTNIPAATPPRQPVRMAEQAGLAEGGPAEGYRFGGGGTPHAPATATRDAPSPFGKSAQLPPSRSIGGPSRSAMEALAKRASVAIARPRTESDDERSMMDDRSAVGADSDDEGHRHNRPSASSRVNRPSSGASSNGARASPYDDEEDEPMPPGINLGRRTSVSAESLTPSMLNGPPAPKVVIPKTPSQRERIEASISGNLLFRNLDEGQYEDVLNAMKEVRVGRGTEVIVQGAVGDYFYVVEEGSFDVYVRGPPTYTYVPASNTNQAPSDRNTPSPSRAGQTITTQAPSKKVHTYGPGGSFGELALMYNAPRAATVVATSSSATLWALDRVTFRSILMEHTSRKRGMYESFLASVPILGSLTPQEISKVADALEQRTYGEGESVVREGEPGKEFYIVESGRAEVLKRARDGGQDVVGSLKTGDYFGGPSPLPPPPLPLSSAHGRDGRAGADQLGAEGGHGPRRERDRPAPGRLPGRKGVHEAVGARHRDPRPKRKGLRPRRVGPRHCPVAAGVRAGATEVKRRSRRSTWWTCGGEDGRGKLARGVALAGVVLALQTAFPSRTLPSASPFGPHAHPFSPFASPHRRALVRAGCGDAQRRTMTWRMREGRVPVGLPI